MNWSRQQFGLVGDSGRPANLRIELEVVRDPAGDHPVGLDGDGDGIGTYARVYRGQLRQGGFKLPLALKIQRDKALNDELSKSVAAKFDSERLAYVRLDVSGAQDHEQNHTVRYFDFANNDDEYAPKLPPTLVCRHAAHALTLVCPHCSVELTEKLDERALECGQCSRTFPDHADNRKLLREHAVRRDAACAGCEQSPSECRLSAHLLNFFPARLLAFELLDLDLADFLDEWAIEAKRIRHASFWAAYRADLSNEPTGAVGLPRLAETLRIYRQLVAGVRRLHAQGITHLDLKPRNVCLCLEGGQATARLIDLGFALPPASSAFLLQVQRIRHLDSEYAAPEVRKAPDSLRMMAQSRPNDFWLRASPVPHAADSAFDPLVQPGDEVEVSFADRNQTWTGRVSSTKIRKGEDALDLFLAGADQPACAGPTSIIAVVRKHTGPAADLFSLGMILFELLTGEQNMRGIWSSLESWLDAFLEKSPGEPLTHGMLAKSFAALTHGRGSFGQPFAHLKTRFGDGSLLAEELLGIALRLIYRSDHAILNTYVPSRASDNTADALARLEADLTQFERLLREAWEAKGSESRRVRLLSVCRQLRRELGGSPGKSLHGETKTARAVNPDVLVHALALGESGADRRTVLRQLVQACEGDVVGLRRQLQRMEQLELVNPASPAEAEAAAKKSSASIVANGSLSGVEVAPEWEALVEVLRLASARDADLNDLQRFRRLARAVQRLSLSKTHRESPQQVWLSRALVLLNSIDNFERCLRQIELLNLRVGNVFVQTLAEEREKRPTNRRPLVFRLHSGLRPYLREVEAQEAVGLIRKQFKAAAAIQASLQSRWRHAFAAWAKVTPYIRAPFHAHAEAARRRSQELPGEFDNWAQAAEEHLTRAAEYVEDVVTHIAQPWDRARQPRRFGSPREAWLSFDYDFVEWHEQCRPAEMLEGLARLHLGPAAMIQAHLLMQEYSTIRELDKGDA